MLIVDSQVHIWGADTPQRPWPKCAEPQRPVPLDKDELLREMDVAAVDRAVIMPPSWEGDRNDLGIEAATLHPRRFAVMGRLDPQDPRSRGYIRQAYDAFGPQRLFSGSDLSRSPIPYRQHVTMFTEEIPWLTNEDKEWIMGRGVCEWIGWALR